MFRPDLLPASRYKNITTLPVGVLIENTEKGRFTMISIISRYTKSISFKRVYHNVAIFSISIGDILGSFGTFCSSRGPNDPKGYKKFLQFLSFYCCLFPSSKIRRFRFIQLMIKPNLLSTCAFILSSVCMQLPPWTKDTFPSCKKNREHDFFALSAKWQILYYLPFCFLR